MDHHGNCDPRYVRGVLELRKLDFRGLKGQIDVKMANFRGLTAKLFRYRHIFATRARLWPIFMEYFMEIVTNVCWMDSKAHEVTF